MTSGTTNPALWGACTRKLLSGRTPIGYFGGDAEHLLVASAGTSDRSALTLAIVRRTGRAGAGAGIRADVVTGLEVVPDHQTWRRSPPKDVGGRGLEQLVGDQLAPGEEIVGRLPSSDDAEIFAVRARDGAALRAVAAWREPDGAACVVPVTVGVTESSQEVMAAASDDRPPRPRWVLPLAAAAVIVIAGATTAVKVLSDRGRRAVPDSGSGGAEVVANVARDSGKVSAANAKTTADPAAHPVDSARTEKAAGGRTLRSPEDSRAGALASTKAGSTTTPTPPATKPEVPHVPTDRAELLDRLEDLDRTSVMATDDASRETALTQVQQLKEGLVLEPNRIRAAIIEIRLRIGLRQYPRACAMLRGLPGTEREKPDVTTLRRLACGLEGPSTER